MDWKDETLNYLFVGYKNKLIQYVNKDWKTSVCVVIFESDTHNLPQTCFCCFTTFNLFAGVEELLLKVLCFFVFFSCKTPALHNKRCTLWQIIKRFGKEGNDRKTLITNNIFWHKSYKLSAQLKRMKFSRRESSRQ